MYPLGSARGRGLLLAGAGAGSYSLHFAYMQRPTHMAGNGTVF